MKRINFSCGHTVRLTISPTTGRENRLSADMESRNDKQRGEYLCQVIMKLQQWEDAVRRIISAILIIAGVHSTGITQLTGLCERSIRDLKNQIAAGDTDSLFETRSGRGRKSKFKDVESQIVEGIERGSYQTLQQIADMVQEKFGINASIMAVSRFLKKTKSAG